MIRHGIQCLVSLGRSLRNIFKLNPLPLGILCTIKLTYFMVQMRETGSISHFVLFLDDNTSTLAAYIYSEVGRVVSNIPLICFGYGSEYKLFFLNPAFHKWRYVTVDCMLNTAGSINRYAHSEEVMHRSITQKKIVSGYVHLKRVLFQGV